jgi:hypothetical protein
MSTFLLTGFELEDSQYVIPNWIFHHNQAYFYTRYLLRREKGSKTAKELADLQDKRTTLLRQIRNWRVVQLVYMPQVSSLLPSTTFPDDDITPESDTLPTHAEDLPLFLPSSLPPNLRNLPELQSICGLERRLREPLASDALANIRRQRRIIQGLWQFKKLNVSGTGNKPNTRMITLYNRFRMKTERAAQKYRVARSALATLDPNGAWQVYSKELKDSDISGPGRDPQDKSNSRYEPSWIWLVPRVNDSGEAEIVEDEFNDNMRVEWAKARARMIRWKEELQIVQQEMRRMLAYQVWRADWWRQQANRHEQVDSTMLSGLKGYAYKQALICTRMAEQCAITWLPRLKEKGIQPAWESDYITLLTNNIQNMEDTLAEDNFDDSGMNSFAVELDSDIMLI